MGDRMTEVLQEARDQFNSGKTRSLAFRKENLRGLLRFYQENEAELTQVLYEDLKKPPEETVMSEVAVLLKDCKTMLANLDSWSKTKTVSRGLSTLLDWPYVLPEPYGVVLVMSAWNYPLQLLLLPLGGAIAAGNCAILKPSELAPATAAFLADRLPDYLDPACFPVVCGGVAESQRLLRFRFDYVFFTGSSAVGRIVREAANLHLTPVTLELGGKSPVYLDQSVNMEYAARRILWGKTVNLGQTCIAPDYLLCDKETESRFLDAARGVLRKWFGEEPEKSTSLGRLLNSKHFGRVQKLINSGGRVALGGRCFSHSGFIEPTILVDVPPNSEIMQEEIFGPVLPIVTVNSVQEAVNFINHRTPHALSLYVFSTKRDVKNRLIRETSTGTVMCNDTMYHAIVEQLPFGGIGVSGMGAYHGRFSFDTFTHYKPVLERNYSPLMELCCGVRYPPYTPGKLAVARLFLKNPAVPDLSLLKYLVVFCLGAIALLLLRALARRFEFEDELPEFLI